tara:strand:+ start:1903 stop:2097 length:195 start_codon:yes stop_codon:yes gene_type:complete
MKELILFSNRNTKYPEKYSEGVFVWEENEEIRTTLEYNLSKGGDPEVYEEWLETNQEIISKRNI